MTARHDGLDALDRLRQTLGYEATLGRGYAVVWAGDRVVTTAEAAGREAALEVQFRDGRLGVGPGAGSKRSGKSKTSPPQQGSLF